MPQAIFVIASEALHRMVYRAKRGNFMGLFRHFLPTAGRRSSQDNLSMKFTTVPWVLI